MVDIIPAFIGLLTTFPVNIIIVIAVIAVIVYYLIPRFPHSEPHFEIEDFRESVFIYCKTIMDSFGIDSNSILTKGIEPQGGITKWYRFIGQFPKFRYNKKNNQMEPTEEMENLDFMIFQIGKRGFFDWLFRSDGNVKYVIVDKDLLDYNGHNNAWSIQEKISLVPYANVFVASSRAIDFINNISFQRSQEELLTYAQNYARKTAWLELAHAKTMDRIIGKLESKGANFEKFRADALKGPEDDEEE
jgi:hypothetical protein